MRFLSPGAVFGALVLAACGAHRKEFPAPIPHVAGEVRTPFALRYIDMTKGTGALAGPRKCLYANYTGWLTNGKKFDSSRDTMPNGQPRQPISFPQGGRRVIAGWDAGFEGMHVGGQRRLIIPYQLAYGELGRPPVIPPKAELIFDVELMAVADTLTGPPPAAAPGVQTPPGPRCPTWEDVRRSS
jgi:peptidylprolyl isomerase